MSVVFGGTALKISPLFSSHMVLQRNKPIRIWGEGNGEIIVAFKNQLKTAVSNGKDCTVWPLYSRRCPRRFKQRAGARNL